MKIIKRNGDIVPFDKLKITSAIRKAMVECNVNPSNAESVTEDVIKKLHGEYIEIEDIQNEVEDSLMDLGFNDVAKAYILYRLDRERKRNESSKLYDEAQKTIADIMESKNIENANANVDEGSFSGKNSKVTSHFLKEYALNNLMDKEVAQAHRTGLLYTHDLDNYCSGMHNCLNIDFYDLFENNGGFETRNGDVRKPNDIMTFFQLVAVTFQCQSQVL